MGGGIELPSAPLANLQQYLRPKLDVKKIAEAAGQFFADPLKQPFFLSVNFSDAHFPLLKQQNGLPGTKQKHRVGERKSKP